MQPDQRSDDFWRDYNQLVSRGVTIVREPKVAEYGTVAVFADLYGNLWDLVELGLSGKREQQSSLMHK